jgi:hypothetical protein
MTLDLAATKAGDVALEPAEASRPLPQSRPVALDGKMGADGYVPENDAWFAYLTQPDDETRRVDHKGRPRRIGRNPMSIPPDVLTAAGHGPRRTSG